LLGIGAFVLLQAGCSPRTCRAIQYSGGWCFCCGGCGIRTLPRPPAILTRPGSPANRAQVQASSSPSAWRGSFHQRASSGMAQGIKPPLARRSASSRGSAAGARAAGADSTGLASGFAMVQPQGRRQPGGSPLRSHGNGAQRSLSDFAGCGAHGTKGTARRRRSRASQEVLFQHRSAEPLRQPCVSSRIHFASHRFRSGCRCQLQIGCRGSWLELFRARPGGSQFHAVVGGVGCRAPQSRHRAIFKRQPMPQPTGPGLPLQAPSVAAGHHPWLISSHWAIRHKSGHHLEACYGLSGRHHERTYLAWALWPSAAAVCRAPSLPAGASVGCSTSRPGRFQVRGARQERWAGPTGRMLVGCFGSSRASRSAGETRPRRL